MPEFSDEELLDFDKSRLADWDGKRAAEALEQMPELYRNHLTVAKWIDYWREDVEEQTESGISLRGDEFHKGMVQALRDIAAHLRQTDLLPTGILYKHITGED